MQIKWVLVSTVLTLLCGTNAVESYKILGVFPMWARSHYILGSSIMKKLAKEGHEVTVIAPFSEKEKLPNYHEVSTSSIAEQTKGLKF